MVEDEEEEEECISRDDFDPVSNFDVSAICLWYAEVRLHTQVPICHGEYVTQIVSFFHSKLLNEDDSLVTARYARGGISDRTLLNMAALKTGRHDLVKVLIDAGSEIDALDSDGYTALSYGMYGGALSARLLMEAGSDLTVISTSGDTLLHDAASAGHVNIARIILRAGVDIDTQNMYGDSPLMWAADVGESDMVKFLVKQGAKVNLVNHEQSNALHKTAFSYYRRPEIVRTLLEAGADVTALGYLGMTPLVAAINNGIVSDASTEVVKLLIIPGPSLLAVDPRTDNNVLNMCIAKEIPECTRLLLELGPDTLPFTLEEVSDQGITPLMQTIRSDQYESAMLLIDNGADVNVKLDPTPGNTDIPSGTTPLMLATRNSNDNPGSLELVQKLLDNGANVLTTDADGDTSFTIIAEMTTASESSEEVLAALIRAIPSASQAFIDAPNSDSKSPLRLSFEIAFPDNPEELAHTYQFVEAGADLAVLPVPHFEWLTQQAIADERHKATNKIFDVQFRVAAVAEVVPGPQVLLPYHPRKPSRLFMSMTYSLLYLIF